MMLPADEVLPDVLPVAAPSNPPNTLAMVEPVLLFVVVAAWLADVVLAADAEVVAPVVASVEVDVDVFVDVFFVAFEVDVFEVEAFEEDVFEVDFFVDFFVVFFTGINSELEALSAASFMALALLPAVHASTRAAIRITFFILLSI